jgi:hypothetical protein
MEKTALHPMPARWKDQTFDVFPRRITRGTGQEST